MTYSLSQIQEALVRPSRQFAVTEILGSPTNVPSKRGIYAWWFANNSLPQVPSDSLWLDQERRGLYYVGIAPSGPGNSKRTLRDRLKNHCHGPVKSSTLRTTLASLKAVDLNLTLARLDNGRRSIGNQGEQRLTKWMCEEALVSWVECEAPWEVEDALVANVPLNIKGATHGFVTDLRRLRAWPKDTL